MPRLATLTALLILAGAARADEAKELAKRYGEARDSWRQRALIEGLDPSAAGVRTFLREVLAKEPWYQREGAVAVLGRLEGEGPWKELQADRRPAVQEGLARALGLRGVEALAPLVELLGHKEWQVRRGAAIGLRSVLRPESIEALIKAWEGEQDFRVWIHCLQSLEALSGEGDLATAQDWRAWWDARRESFSFAQRGAKDSGERIRTRARGTNLELRSRGRGLPLLVLPEYGYDQIYLETYLRDLEDTQQVLYLKLPGAADFGELKPAPGLPDPYYPIERLVDSLDSLHQQLVAEQKIQDKPFAILAHGMTGWIAMAYATKYPRKVRKLILVAPYSGGAAWSEGRDRVEARGVALGDQEMVHFAQSQLYGGYEAPGEDEAGAVERKEFSCYFADARDLEIGRLFGPLVTKTEGEEEYESRQIARPLGTVVIPEFELSERPRAKVPTLVVHGERSIRTSLSDAAVVAKHFGGKVARFKESARMPFYEEHEAFVKALRRFLR